MLSLRRNLQSFLLCLIIHQIIYAHPIQLSKSNGIIQIRHGLTILPFCHCLTGNTDFLSHLLLGVAHLFPQCIQIHRNHIFHTPFH